MSFISLGALADLMDASFSGFDYPNIAQVVPLLGDVNTGGSAVIQSSALTLRQAALEFYAEDADALIARGYYEQRTQVSFTDFAGTVSGVIILEFTRTLVMSGLWSCSATLVEMLEPTVLGS